MCIFFCGDEKISNFKITEKKKKSSKNEYLFFF